jgi:hypothetical protein
MGWGYGWGWGWNPCGVDKILLLSSSTEGTLFIDLIDAKKNWFGSEGISYLNQNQGDKKKRINEFVAAILKQYPPQSKIVSLKIQNRKAYLCVGFLHTL